MLDSPISIPAGLRVELSGAKLSPGASQTTDVWMAMLNDRIDECPATLGRNGWRSSLSSGTSTARTSGCTG